MVSPAQTLRPTSRDNQIQAVVDKVEDYDLVGSSSWSDLDALSTHTYVDGIKVDPEGVILDKDGRFRGVMNVYVLLKYGTKDSEGFETSDSFLGRFHGHFDNNGDPVIDDISVDTSPFYEGESEARE